MDKLYITVGELAEHLNCPTIGDKNKKIFSIALYQDSDDDSVTYIPYNKINVINDIKAGAIITRASIGLPLHRSYIVTRRDPHEVLADTIDFMIAKGLYCMENHNKPIISDSAVIADNVFIRNGTVIGNDTILSNGVVIGENVTVGNNCFIGVNTVIGDNCIIGDNSSVGACCSIGTENFEYHKFENGWKKIPEIGYVRIGDNVIIGGNVVVEKGTIGTTVIGDFTHIENLVQIGHEAKIGIHCHIMACVAIAGWAEIGNYVDIYGQSAVSNRVKVGDNSILLARTGADKNIDNNMVISGYPAQNHRIELKYQAFLRKLFRKNIRRSDKE
ncbi:MAG: UDP-3-O-(3-hydroxymyristoyl)glucosamine N-acyltransferase [Ruminococcus flavefaciens]|nr:UDP-3-O-(3-hydroxymyristoyl)glucosamine N-acyltransferase [Ruminococcus flavefaciens]MCM1231237.1 UDP-3-O-(3-hydroxymyristoyl)glucosamine N-acyltransferase [Ruminococcus flavefaciens]